MTDQQRFELAKLIYADLCVASQCGAYMADIKPEFNSDGRVNSYICPNGILPAIAMVDRYYMGQDEWELYHFAQQDGREWISVKDRLPDNIRDVEVITDKKDEFPDRVLFYDKRYKNWYREAGNPIMVLR